MKFYPNQKSFVEFYSALFKQVGLSLDDLEKIWEISLKNTENRFSKIKNKYYRSVEDGQVLLRAAHIGHSALFIYELSRQAYVAGDLYLADRLYYLNNSVNSLNILYEIEMPESFFCDHPVGTVVGRASFVGCKNFSFSSQCLIGNSNSQYPEIAGALTMYPGSVLLGNSRIEGNVILSNGSSVKDAGVLKDCIVYGVFPHNEYKHLSEQKYLQLSNFV